MKGYIIMLKERIDTELKKAMKNLRITDDRDAVNVRLSTLRSVKASITEAETSGKSRKELNDSEVENVIRKGIKTRKDSAEIYANAGETSRADAELAEVAVLSEFVPEQLSEVETEALVKQIIDEQNLADEGMKAMGKVMKQLKSNSAVDPGLASKITKNLLQ